MPDSAHLRQLVRRVSTSIRTGERPLTLVLGSGATVPNIPGVDEVVNRIQARYDDPELSRAIEETSDAPEAYRAAFSYVNREGGARAVAAVVQSLVLDAYQGPQKASLLEQLQQPVPRLLTDADLREIESAPEQWLIPAGLRSLAQLLNTHRTAFAKRIFTTNFDPLIELALREIGLEYSSVVLPADGDPAIVDGRDFTVVHVHGGYHGDTLHSVELLDATRPTLETAIQIGLQEADVLVIGYSGWDDVINRAFDRLLRVSSVGIEVMWAFVQASVPKHVRNRSLGGSPQSPRVAHYAGVDRDVLFEDVLREVTAERQPEAAARPVVAMEPPPSPLTLLVRQFDFGRTSLTRVTEPAILFWPHRLRAPHLLHAVFAAAGAALARSGLAIELYLDDMDRGRGESLTLRDQFNEAIGRWFARFGVDSQPTARLLSEEMQPLLDDISLDSHPWNIAKRYLGSSRSTALTYLQASKVLNTETLEAAHSGHADYLLLRLQQQNTPRLLTPFYIWGLLKWKLDTGAFPPEGVLTLGGSDETSLWQAWDSLFPEAPVGHLFLPHLQWPPPESVSTVWDREQLLWEQPYTPRALESELRAAWAKQGSAQRDYLVPWVFRNAILLAYAVSSGQIQTLEIDGQPIDSPRRFLDVAAERGDEICPLLAQGVAAWFYEN